MSDEKGTDAAEPREKTVYDVVSKYVTELGAARETTVNLNLQDALETVFGFGAAYERQRLRVAELEAEVARLREGTPSIVLNLKSDTSPEGIAIALKKALDRQVRTVTWKNGDETPEVS